MRSARPGQRERATSTRSLRLASTAAVLDALWHGDAVTGSDLIATTGLTRATVHDVCADLIAAGWVEELADQRAHGSYARGRPARRYGLRARAGVVVGLEASSARCAALVTDLLGARVGAAESACRRDAGERRTAAAEAVAAALAEAGASADDVLACTVAVPAPVAASGRVEVRSNPYWVLMEAGLREHLERLLPCPVRLANDADLAALAEGRSGAAAGLLDHATVLADGGFGAGLVTAGSLVRGRWGRGGEMRWLDLVTGVGAPVGLGPLLALWDERGTDVAPDPPGPLEAEPGTGDLEADIERARQLLRLAADGDGHALALADRAGQHLARVVATAAGLFDPEVVVVAGELAEDLGPVVDVAARLLPDLLDEPVPRLVASALGGGVIALGAVQQALDDVRAGALELRLPGAAASLAER
ncbi:ROK family protein [Quadrisphaera sp. KR29]|uniref:ROK family protein n=1 Tax=Quadrisphaera sp. KR29 TaxID=3461391 RepID=UPI00404511C7